MNDLFQIIRESIPDAIGGVIAAAVIGIFALFFQHFRLSDGVSFIQRLLSFTTKNWKIILIIGVSILLGIFIGRLFTSNSFPPKETIVVTSTPEPTVIASVTPTFSLVCDVPDTIGMEASDAIDRLKAIGLQPIIKSEPNESFVFGVVFDQSITPGILEPCSGEIELTVSSGKSATIAPTPTRTPSSVPSPTQVPTNTPVSGTPTPLPSEPEVLFFDDFSFPPKVEYTPSHSSMNYTQDEKMGLTMERGEWFWLIVPDLSVESNYYIQAQITYVAGHDCFVDMGFALGSATGNHHRFLLVSDSECGSDGVAFYENGTPLFKNNMGEIISKGKTFTLRLESIDGAFAYY